MNGRHLLQVETVQHDIVEEDRECKPETGALQVAFRFERQGSTARVVPRQKTVLARQFGGQAAKLMGGNRHGTLSRLLDHGVVRVRLSAHGNCWKLHELVVIIFKLRGQSGVCGPGGPYVQKRSVGHRRRNRCL